MILGKCENFLTTRLGLGNKDDVGYYEQLQILPVV